MLRSLRKKRPEWCLDKSRLLPRNNAAAQKTLSIRQFIAKWNIAILEQPPYSPDIVSYDIFFFSTSSKGSSRKLFFKGMEVIKEAVTRKMYLRRILPVMFGSMTENGRKFIRHDKVILKGKLYHLLFGIKINSLWQISRIFFNTPRICTILSTFYLNVKQTIYIYIYIIRGK